jgi:hypothetical protein
MNMPVKPDTERKVGVMRMQHVYVSFLGLEIPSSRIPISSITTHLNHIMSPEIDSVVIWLCTSGRKILKLYDLSDPSWNYTFLLQMVYFR